MRRNTKRLFLFAGYDPDGIIDDTLVHYLSELSKLGDIVLVMDSDVADTSKLKQIKNLLHFETVRHGEYDFGSYKRGYLWAHSKKILDKYDWIYMVNDSVYGPLFDLEPELKDLESRGVDLIGMSDSFDKDVPKHIQSWFIGVSNLVATSETMYNFMCEIRRRDTKREIVRRYEAGLSRTLLQHGYKMSAFFNQYANEVHTMYEQPNVVLDNFVPFIKKAALRNLKYDASLLPYAPDDLIKKIYENARRVHLPISVQCEYTKWFRFALLSIPIITIAKKIDEDSKQTLYKVYIFDKLPIIKIAKSNVTK